MRDYGTSVDFKSTISAITSALVPQNVSNENDTEREYLSIPAPNIIEFVSSPEFMNVSTLWEHKRQYQVLRDVFQCRCPICNPNTPEAIDCWDKGKEYLQSENLLVWSKTYNDDVCPKCGLTRKEFETDDLLKRYNQVTAIVGMRSGKTATFGEIGTYIEHRLTTIALNQPDGKLSTYFGVLPKNPFEVTFIASTEVQSSETIWAYYLNFRRESPWFRRCVEWMQKEQKKQTLPVGMKRWKYLETTNEIDNGYLGVKFNSKNSNSAGLAGRTRIASMIDEISRFKQTESAMSAEEAYRVMENSLQTVRSAVENRGLLSWLGWIGVISSPISVDDKGMQLLAISKDIKRMYACHYATWDFNPNEKREYYDEKYQKDPIGTERDFGARPPLAANPLVINPEVFEERAVDTTLVATATIDTIPFVDKTGQRYHRALMSDCRLLRDAPRFVVFDAGLNFDSFSGSASHLEIRTNNEGRQEFVTVFDWLFKVLPTDEQEVWFDSCVDIIKMMKKHQQIACVEFDRWNSISLIQQIRNEGVRAEQKGLKPDDYIAFVSDAHLGHVRMLPPDPEDANLEAPFKSGPATALYELKRLERSIDDKRIYNPQKGKRRGHNSDDCAVVAVHGHKMCQDSQIQPQGAKLRSREARLKREEAGGTQWSYGGAGRVFSSVRAAGGKSGTAHLRRW